MLLFSRLSLRRGSHLVVPERVHARDPLTRRRCGCALSRSTWLQRRSTRSAARRPCLVVYALVVVADWKMAAVFGVNAAFCLAIVLLASWKRDAAKVASDTSRCEPRAGQPGAHLRRQRRGNALTHDRENSTASGNRSRRGSRQRRFLAQALTATRCPPNVIKRHADQRATPPASSLQTGVIGS